MARAAGLRAGICRTIAYASQFVDDNAGNDEARFKDGGGIDYDASAHHTLDIKNVMERDQRYVWVPFHFLPGNQGDNFTERLVCRKNSNIAQEMVKHHLEMEEASFAVELLGVAAHVYADTFSHYGFSGVSSRHNRVINDSWKFFNLNPDVKKYITDKAEAHKKKYWDELGGLLINIKSSFAEVASGALGHGAVLTFPDRPYLKWSFEYELPKPRRERRSNRTTFLEGCEALYSMFHRFADIYPRLAENGGKKFADIHDRVKRVISTQGPMDDRIKAWQEASESGDLFVNGGESIPSYDEAEWGDVLKDMKDKENSEYALSTHVYRFFQAVSLHRNYVLRELLPKHKLIVA